MQQTINLLISLREDSLTVIKWWVDASYAAHPDMMRNTEASMYLGRVSLPGIAKKYRINAKSSTEG